MSDEKESPDASNSPGEKESPAAGNNGDTQFSEKDIAEVAGAACKDAAGEVKEVLKQAAAWGIEPGDPNLSVSFKNSGEGQNLFRRWGPERTRGTEGFH